MIAGGVPDTVQLVKHGALLILVQFHNIGHAIRGTHEPDLRHYTQVGDGASRADGRLYDPKLGPNETKGDYSGKPDGSLDLHHQQLIFPVECHRGAGCSGGYAERLGQRVRATSSSSLKFANATVRGFSGSSKAMPLRDGLRSGGSG